MSETIEQKLESLDEFIDDYLESLSLNIKKNNDFEKITNLNLDEIKSLDYETCAEYATLASIFSLYLQEEYNKHSAKYKWAQHNLKICLGNYASSYGDKYTKFEERSLMVVADNEHAKKLNQVIKETVTRMETLNFISMKVEKIYQSLSDLARSKRKYESH